MAEQTQPTTPVTQRSRLWLVIPSIGAVLIGAAVLVLLFVGNPIVPRPVPPPAPLDGEMNIWITPPGPRQDSVKIDTPTALPVRPGDTMRIELEFKEPACSCLVWIDSQGNVVPLYPWNDGSIEVKSANEPPPVRRASKFVNSPVVIGAGWPFDKHGGLETVLLLARRTPLPQDLPLADLLKGMPKTKMRSPKELADLRIQRDPPSVATILALNRGDETETREIDLPLVQRMEKLRDHFEIVWAVRFAHRGE